MSNKEVTENQIKIIVDDINQALRNGLQVRLTNDWEHMTSTLSIENESPVLLNFILTPSYLNCTHPGTPCRVIKYEHIGMNMSGQDHWSLYLSNIGNAHDKEMCE